MNSTLVLQLGCSHQPKVVKKRGILTGQICEILVCVDCKNDPDLKNFEEILL
jgi:hypothetical protein